MVSELIHISSPGIFLLFFQERLPIVRAALNCFPPHDSDGKESACNAGDLGSIPGSGRSPWEGNGYPLQGSFLENSMDRGAWQATGHAVAQELGLTEVTNTSTFRSWRLNFSATWVYQLCSQILISSQLRDLGLDHL